MKGSEVLYTYISPAISILTLILNTVEIIALAKQYRRNRRNGPRRLSNPLIFLANLALSDLLVGLTVAIVKAIYFLSKHRVIRPTLPTAWTMHVLKYAFLRLSLLTSVFNLVSLTIDRLLAIRFPIVYRVRVGNKHVWIIVAVTWFLSTAAVAVQYYLSNFSGKNLIKYDLVIFPAVVFPAALIFAACYGLIAAEVRRQGRYMRSMAATFSTAEPVHGNSSSQTRQNGVCCSKNDESGNENNTVRSLNNTCINRTKTKENSNSNSNNSNVASQSSNNRKIDSNGANSSNRAPLHIHKREWKIYRFAVTVVSVFLLCWLPIAVCGLLIVVKIPVDSFAVNIVFTLSFLNSVIDPLVYFAFNDKFGVKLRRFLGFIFRSRISWRVDQRMCIRRDLFSMSSGEPQVMERSRSGSAFV